MLSFMCKNTEYDVFIAELEKERILLIQPSYIFIQEKIKRGLPTRHISKVRNSDLKPRAHFLNDMALRMVSDLPETGEGFRFVLGSISL